MLYRCALTFIICCLIALTTRAATFTVTSNADSGPGTLREALTLAAVNGSATQDIIIFNIPDLTVAGRTITLVTQLPLVSSNLVIDGSTQPGLKFGDSDARVRITTPVSQDAFITLRLLNVSDVEVYGLYLLDYTYTSALWTNYGQRTGMQIENSTNITFGAPNKGNLIKGFHDLSITAKQVNGLKVVSNIIGLNENNNFDHPPYNNPELTAGISFLDCENLLLGGDALQEGNIFFCPIDIGFTDKTIVHNVAIKSNNMGVFKDGISTSTSYQDEFVVNIYTVGINSSTTNPDELNKAVTINLVIKNNLVGNFGRAFYLNGLKGNVSFTNNYIGVGRDGVISVNHGNSRPNEGAGLNIENSLAEVTIGGADASTKNYFFDHFVAVGAQNSPNVLIRNNEYRCLTFGAFSSSEQANLPQIKITKRTPAGTQTTISGTASPNAIIDIYGSASCDYNNCSIGNMITTVTANATGNWSATVIITGTVYASASIDNRTSLFKSFEVGTANIIINHVRCGFTGSITGASVPEGSAFHWVDDHGNIVGNDLDLVAGAGKYKLILSDCNESPFYEIKDNKVLLFEYAKVITPASCNASTGSIKGIFYNDPLNLVNSVVWKNDNGDIVSNQIEAINLPAGNYSLTIKTLDGCEKKYGPLTITVTDGPQINESAITKTPGNCSVNNGSIHGITASGTNVKYSWKNEQGVEVGTDANLDDKPAGKYILAVTDDSNCAPVYSSQIEIPLVNDIGINVTNKQIQDATCDDYNGSITGITVTGTGTSLWTNEHGVSFGSDLNLSGVPAGKYKLTVTSANCPPVVTEYFFIGSINGVSLDLTNVNVISATCEGNNGSIKGLQSNNVTKIQWRLKGTTNVIANTLDITGKAAGDYVLTIGNATCEKSFDFTIEQIPPVVFPDFPATYTKSCEAFGTGTISLNTGTGPQPVEFRWMNSNGERVGYSNKAEFLPAGNYKLYLRDKNGCEDFYKDYTVDAYPEFKVTTFGNLTNAQCGVSTGAVSPTLVTGGTGNYVYEWRDESGTIIPGKTQNFIDNMPPGKYVLKITDGGCSLAEPPYEILNVEVEPPMPLADDVKVFNAGNAAITVNNPFPTAIYRLYETANSTTPIKEAIGGKFDINVTESRSYYISLTYGSCESARLEVKVFLSILIGNIVNSFTPNNDGINDYWVIKGLDTYPDATVKVFNRNGQSVFQSQGYSKPFDGNYNGKPLPTGVYYYIIGLKKGNVLSGSLTIIR